jgi:hypothetical protein
MNNTMKRLAAGAAIGALAIAGIAVGGAAAYAVGGALSTNTKFELFNSSGTAITSGSTTALGAISGIHIDSTCSSSPMPADSQAIFGLYKTDGTFIGTPGQFTDPSADGLYGSNGLKSSDTQVLLTAATGAQAYIAQASLATGAANNGFTTLPNGSYQLRYVCYVQAGGANAAQADLNANYFVLPITITGTTFNVTVPPAPLVGTTTALSATTGTGSATFTAAVTPVAGTATPTGTVVVNSGATALCTITLPATACTASGLVNGGYSVIAVYSGDTVFSGSSSTAYNFIMGALGTAVGTITVNIPNQGNTGLTLTGTPSATINTTHTAGNRFTGSATIGTVTVTDERQFGAPTWHLQGALTTLNKGTAATIPATDLGWAPSLVGTAGAANAYLAAAVTPAHAGGTGFNATKPLASGDVPTNSAATTTGVAALLSVDTDGNKPFGAYVGTLTITLTAP